MGSRSLGVLTLDLVAKTSGFVQGMSKAERESAKFKREVKKNLESAGNSIKLMAAASVAGFGLMVTNTVQAAKEIRNLKTVAGTTGESLQEIAYGAKTLGIPMEKVADILKDVNDKVGDFLQTGGGPLADFFENIAPQVGVTADQFKNLSSDQALGLYVSSLEKANLSQNEMTFFMEAIASDATALIPLFKDNGKELKNLSKEAHDFGAVISDIDLRRLGDVQGNINKATAAFEGLKNEAVLGALPAIEDLTKLLSDEATISGAKALANAIASSFTAATNAIATTVNVIQFIAEEMAAITVGISSEDIVRLEKDAEKIRGLLSKNSLMNLGERIRFFGPDGIVEFYSTDELKQKLLELDGAIKSYYDNLKNRPEIPLSPVVPEDNRGGSSEKPIKSITEHDRKAAEAAKKLADAARAAKQAIDDQVAALQFEADILGKSSTEAALFQLKLEGATQSQLDSAAAALEQVDAYNKLAEINASALDIAEGLKGQEQLIRESYDRRRQIIIDSTEFTGEAQRNLLVTLEQKRQDELNELNAGFWENYLASTEENLLNLDKLTADMLSNVSSSFGSAFESIVFDFQSLEDAGRSMAESLLRSVVNALGQMAAQWIAYQAVQLLVGSSTQASAASTMTANALAAQQMAALNAFSSTAAIPIVGPVAAPAAAATALAATAPFVAGVTASSLAGIAHDGIDAVPETGTWLLEKGERVTTAETSAKLDKTLSELNTGGGGVVVNLIENKNKAGTIEERTSPDGRAEIDAFVSDIYSDGPRSRAMRGAFGLNRAGR